MYLRDHYFVVIKKNFNFTYPKFGEVCMKEITKFIRHLRKLTFFYANFLRLPIFASLTLNKKTCKDFTYFIILLHQPDYMFPHKKICFFQAPNKFDSSFHPKLFKIMNLFPLK